MRAILKDEVKDPAIIRNIQYVFKFFLELLDKSEQTKMDIHNIGIVLGPNLLWPTNNSSSAGEKVTYSKKLAHICSSLI